MTLFASLLIPKTHPRLPSITQRARSNSARPVPARMSAESHGGLCGRVGQFRDGVVIGSATVNGRHTPIQVCPPPSLATPGDGVAGVLEER